MADALTIIRREHRNLGALLACLEGLVEDIERRSLAPEYETFELIFDYLGSYLDRYHHPKEDAYLFDRLRKRDPEAVPIIESLEAEHDMEPSMLAKMRSALADYQSEGEAGFHRFRSAVKAYVEFERSHAITEEREIFERARQHLTAADWQEIDTAFQANEDPLFGEGPTQRYRNLFTLISSRVPTPHGFGKSWPTKS